MAAHVFQVVFKIQFLLSSPNPEPPQTPRKAGLVRTHTDPGAWRQICPLPSLRGQFPTPCLFENCSDGLTWSQYPVRSLPPTPSKQVEALKAQADKSKNIQPVGEYLLSLSHSLSLTGLWYQYSLPDGVEQSFGTGQRVSI